MEEQQSLLSFHLFGAEMQLPCCSIFVEVGDKAVFIFMIFMEQFEIIRFPSCWSFYDILLKEPTSQSLLSLDGISCIMSLLDGIYTQ